MHPDIEDIEAMDAGIVGDAVKEGIETVRTTARVIPAKFSLDNKTLLIIAGVLVFVGFAVWTVLDWNKHKASHAAKAAGDESQAV